MLKPGDTLLFQGDSVTNAFRMPNERNHAYQLGAGYVLLIGAHLLCTRPADHLTLINRGVAGDSLRMMAKRWQDDCVALRPSVISILIGINDTNQFVTGSDGLSPEAYAAAYRDLLTRTQAALPAVRFILGEPFGLEQEMFTPKWRADLAPRQAAVRLLARQFDAVFVPYQAAFDEAVKQAPAPFWIYDGIHPTAAGFGLMARTWLRAVGAAPS